jgi:hypothetical protein
MASAKERLRIFENVIARVGLDGDVLGEYSKAMSALNGLQTYNEMNSPVLPTAITGDVSEGNMQQIPQNEGTLPPLGDNGLNTPQNG